MSIFRTYFAKQSTLIKDNYTNNSRNPIFELIREKDLYSRYIFSLDISELRNKIENEVIPSGTVQSHKINIFSGIRFRKDLIGKNYIDGRLRDSGYQLQLFSFNEEFQEGTEFDYLYNTGLTPTITSQNQQTPNWKYKDDLNQWNQEGIYTGNTATTADTQFFPMGNEDILFDVTTEINNLLFNTTANTINFGISYVRDYETGITGTDKYVTSFFSKYAQSFFEPFLQTTIDNVIEDDRNRFFIDKTNNLYIYLNTVVDSMDKVEIYDYDGTLFQTITGSSINQVADKIYKITTSVTSIYPDMVNFTDKWYFTYNGNQKSIEQEFTLRTKTFTDEDMFAEENTEYYFSVHGIKYGEKISRSEGIKRIQINTKRLYNSSIQDEIPLDYLEYRIYAVQGQQQIEVIPFTKVNMTPNRNYFDIDFSWFIPQHYILELRAKRNGITYDSLKEIKFKVVSEK